MTAVTQVALSESELDAKLALEMSFACTFGSSTDIVTSSSDLTKAKLTTGAVAIVGSALGAGSFLALAFF